MRDQKGQAVLLDVFFASIIFLVVFFSIGNSFESELEKVNQRQETQQMQLKAFAIAESLVKSDGGPSDWETLPVGSIERIGLAKSNLSLSTEKVNQFKNLDPDYSTVKEILLIPQYDYFFELDGTGVTAGIPPASDSTKIVVRRIVEFEGDETVAVFTLYKVQ